MLSLGCGAYSTLVRLIIFLSLAGSLSAKDLEYSFRIKIKSSANGVAEVFYDTGKGFVSAQRVSQNVSATDTVRLVEFPLPAGIRLTGLRLDPLDGPGRFEIGGAEICSADGKVLRTLGPDTFVPRKQLAILSRKPNTLQVEAPPGSIDPILHVKIGKPLTLPKRWHSVELYSHWALAAFAITLFAMSVFSAVTRRRYGGLNKIQSWLDSPRLNWLDYITRRITDPNLIQFDRAALMILAGAALVCVSCSSLRLHGLSTAMWDWFIAGEAPSTGVIVGKPKGIRSDDYCITVPNVFAQVYSKEAFSTHNRSIGGEQTALYWYPANHFIELARFLYWGFHFLPIDLAYSVYWNLKGFILFAGAYLLLMLLTGRSLLSGAGALWLLYSSPTQWWFMAYLPETIAFGSLTMVAGIYLILTRVQRLLVFASIIFVFAALNFALILYPPFGIPTMWVMLFAGAGFVWEKRKILLGPDPLKIRWLALTICFALIIGVLCAFFADTRETFKLIASTVYPGHRSVTGRSADAIPSMISALVESVYSAGHFPRFFLNICEASNYYLGGLMIVPLMFFRRERVRGASAVDLTIMVCLGGLLIYFISGVPEIVAKATLMSASHTSRVKCVIGVASILLLMRYFARFTEYDRSEKPISLVVLALVIAGAVVALILSFLFYARFEVTATVALILVIVNFALVFFAATGRSASFFLLLFALLLPTNMLINPVSRGFDAITDKALYRAISEIHREDPDGKWAVFSPHPLVNVVKFCGVDMINGVKNAPVFEYNEIFDPQHRYIDIWNRYAYVVFNDDQAATISYKLKNADLYEMNLSIASKALDKLGVRYCLLTKSPAPEYNASIVKHLLDGKREYWILCRDLAPTALYNLSNQVLFELGPDNAFRGVSAANQVRIAAEKQALKVTASGDDPQILLPPFSADVKGRIVVRVELDSPSDTGFQVFYLPSGVHDYGAYVVNRYVRRGRNTVYFALDASDFTGGPIRIDPGMTAGEYMLYGIEARLVSE
jgi:hypothetical protein